MSRRILIAANWKMNAAPADFDAPDSPYRAAPAVDVVVFPTFLDLQGCVDAELDCGGQCGRPEQAGAYTGDVSMAMIAGTGAGYVLCGHSERRRLHGDTDENVRAQVQGALSVGLQPIVCVGETAEERTNGKEKAVIKRQLADLPPGCIIAYEPVWAIGTGNTATPEDAQAMHAFIRSLLNTEAQSTRILYGGSMNAKNAEALLRQTDIDGGLIGGASLQPEEFRSIVETAARLSA